MTRISLKETYDNRSVIAQIAKVTDTAEDAAETVQEKAAEINDALTDVNAAVQAAEGAVTTANAASAAAQQSAQTVAGYENRLGAVEGDVVQLNTDVDGVESDLNAVTLRVQTAEGQIVTIQGRVTALETADGQNVKINAVNDYAVGLTGNQNNIGGIKGFVNGISAFPNDWHATYASTGTINDIKLFAKLKNQGAGRFIAIMFTQISNTAPCAGMLIIHNTSSNQVMGWVFRNGFSSNNPLQSDTIVIATDGTDIYLGSRKKVPYGDLRGYVMYSNNYYTFDTNPSPQIEWLDAEINIGTGTGYTIVEASQ